MSQNIPFIKMHGLGNDFVIVESQNYPSKIELEDFARKILDRKTGIGGDQLVIYTPLDASKNVEMSIYNNDGSIVEACGNASRCICKLVYEATNVNSFNLQIGERILPCEIIDTVYQIDMGAVSFRTDWMPNENKLLHLAKKYNLSPKDIICCDIGNPHLVLFSKLPAVDQEIIGKELQNSELFPTGINVNFAHIENSEINLQVYERGAGLTLACGSGACCSFASAKKLGKITDDTKVNFKLGSLYLQTKNDGIVMTGPAESVFKGEYIYG